MRDVLPVAAVIGEGKRVLVENFDKTFRAAAVLDVGLAVRGGGGEKQAVLRCQKRGEVVVDLGAPAAALLDPRIGFARVLAGVYGLDGRSEGHVA